jgi:hypothetical protein
MGLDGHIKAVGGTSTSVQCKPQGWLSALAGAVSGQFPNLVRGQQGLLLMSDTGSQAT